MDSLLFFLVGVVVGTNLGIFLLAIFRSEAEVRSDAG